MPREAGVSRAKPSRADAISNSMTVQESLLFFDIIINTFFKNDINEVY